jgi:hypothetical protein
MNEKQTELARQLVASKHWRWMPGMLVTSDPSQVPRPYGSTIAQTDLFARVVSVCVGRWFGVHEYSVDFPDAEFDPCDNTDLPGTIPDLDDPATIGCLLALVREAWGDQRAHVQPSEHSEQFRVHHLWSGREYHDTEGEALAAALLEAP